MSKPTDPTQPSAKGLMWFGISVFLAIVVIQLVIGSIYFAYRKRYVESNAEPLAEPSLSSPPQGISEPRLQSDPSSDLRDYLARENRLLTSYGWVDRNAEVARIPIERAMEILGSAK